MYPESIKKLIEMFEHLPSIGPKTAERLVFYLLEAGRGEVERLKLALDNLLKSVRSCEICYNFSESSPCAICSDPRRDHSVILVVALSSGVEAFEKNGNFKGVYHVLRGVINPAHGTSENDIRLKELVEKIKNPGQPAQGGREKSKIKEVILGLNPDIDGETTALSISQALKTHNVKVTRLARGMPLGSDIEYADDITLSESLIGRRQM